MTLAVIGDVHGLYDQYVELTQQYEYTLQLGDFGFNYSCLDSVDPTKHKFFKGNHDNYDFSPKDIPHDIGEFGVTEHGGVTFFWMRGAFSIDWQQRVSREHLYGKSWWVEEQLTWEQMEEATELYRQEKPDIVITHSCPHTIAQRIGSRAFLANFGYDPDRFTTNTQQCFETMMQIHQPKLWCLGHFHRPKELEWMGTKFVCIPELGVFTIE